jgi:hypothetical protein
MSTAKLLIQLLHHQWLFDSCVFATVVDDELHTASLVSVKRLMWAKKIILIDKLLVLLYISG